MAKQVINLGTAPTGAGGDDRRSAWVKAKANFTELFNWIANSSQTDDQQTTLPATLPVARGGTGAATAAAARTGLGCKSAAAADIVGTVSQAGGVPTGAIIETGTNANGTYTKYADGTMTCRGQFDYGSVPVTRVIAPGLYSSEVLAGKNFPATFVGVPVVIPDIITSNAMCYSTRPGLPTVTGFQAFYVQSVASATVNVTYVYIAQGRWY